MDDPSFSVRYESIGGTEFVRLVNNRREEYVSIAPEFGGNVNELVLSKNGKRYSVIDGFSSREDFVANKGYKGVKLLPFPNRIADGTYKFGGIEHRLPTNEPELNNAHHGFFYRLAMAEESMSVGDDHAEVTLRNEYRGQFESYPFPFRTRIRYRFDDADKFTMETEVENTGESPMPIGDGWHPYFRIGSAIDELTLRLPPAREIALDERMLPCDSQLSGGFATINLEMRGAVLDALFELSPESGIAVTELRGAGKNPSIRFWQETGRGKYNYICVYTPPDRKSIAIEPMTCSIDAFNNRRGLILLEPRESFIARCGVGIM